MKNKKDLLYLLIIIILIGIAGQFYYSYRYRPAHEIEVYYNKDHELNKEIIQLTRDADKFVYFAVYTFTREDIKDALLAAKYRGLEVVGVSDKDQYKGLESQARIINELREKGIPVYFQDHSAIMHTKVIVTEKGYGSGSYNWTAAATSQNDEVLEIGHDETVRSKYQKILEELFKKYNE